MRMRHDTIVRVPTELIADHVERFVEACVFDRRAAKGVGQMCCSGGHNGWCFAFCEEALNGRRSLQIGRGL